MMLNKMNMFQEEMQSMMEAGASPSVMGNLMGKVARVQHVLADMPEAFQRMTAPRLDVTAVKDVAANKPAFDLHSMPEGVQ
jgi:hypothetical protein